MAWDLGDDVAALGASVSNVAGALYALDTDPDMQFVQSQATDGSAPATALSAELAAQWNNYATIKAAMDDLDTAARHRDTDQATALLAADAVVMPDGTRTGIAAATAALRTAVDALARATADLAAKSRAALSALESAAAETNELEARAAAAHCAHDVELTALRDALGDAMSAFTNDPVNPTAVDGLAAAVATARRRVEAVEASQRSAPDELRAADALLAEIESAVADGAEAYARTCDRIATPIGLQQPLVMDPHDERSLRPWLTRLHEQADAGAWGPVTRGLSEWRRTAQGWLDAARAVCEANRAPLAKRDELRGLLDAYQAKAASMRLGEHSDLARLFADAHDTVHTKPCELSSAEAKVRAYVAAVNATIEQSAGR